MLTMTTRKLPLILLLMIVIVSTVSFLPVQETKATPDIIYSDSQDGYGTATVVSSSGTSMLVGDAHYDLETANFSQV